MRTQLSKHAAISAALLGIAAWTTPSPAQSPPERDSLEALRGALASREDSVALVALEARMIERAREDRDDAFLHLELGFVAYRLAELTGERRHYDDAASEFEWAAELRPQWPYPWYGLGLAELALGEHRVIAIENLRQALGIDHLSKAAGAFARATEADPAFVSAVVDLATTAMAQRIRPRLDVALEAVRRATATPAGADPTILLARGRVERELGEGDSAVVALRRYLDVAGDSSVGLLELARTLYFMRRQDEAHSAYYEGARQARSTDAVALYRGDIAWVAEPDELEAFDAASGAERAEWLRRFWTKRDVAEVRGPGERLAEHYRRYFYALRHYRLVSLHRRYDVVNPYRNDQQLFDDRGIVYVRHGAPTRVAVQSGVDFDPNETWLYADPDGELLFHFVARDDVADYRLVESLLDVYGLETAVQIQTGALPVSVAAELFASRAALHPVYQRLSSVASAGFGPVLATERRLGSRSIDRGTTTDSYPLRFESSLDAVVRNYVVADTAGGGQLLVVFAIPGPSLVPEPLGDGVAYPVEMRLAVSAAGDRAVAFLDTTRTFLTPDVLASNEHLSGFVALPLTPGTYDLRVAVAQPGRDIGQVLRRDGIVVPEVTPPSFTMSDLILGREGSGLAWLHGDVTVDLNPLRVVPRGANLQLYYEIYGLVPGTSYRARVEVKKQGGGSVIGFFKKLFGGGGPPIALTFDGVATGPVTRITQTVALEALDPGQYTLRVVVQAPDGDARHVREERFEVMGT